MIAAIPLSLWSQEHGYTRPAAESPGTECRSFSVAEIFRRHLRNRQIATKSPSYLVAGSPQLHRLWRIGIQSFLGIVEIGGGHKVGAFGSQQIGSSEVRSAIEIIVVER